MKMKYYQRFLLGPGYNGGRSGQGGAGPQGGWRAAEWEDEGREAEGGAAAQRCTARTITMAT